MPSWSPRSVLAAGITVDTVIDLVGTVGRHILAELLPDRGIRTKARTVKRAISNNGTSTRRHGHHHRTRDDICPKRPPRHQPRQANATTR